MSTGRKLLEITHENPTPDNREFRSASDGAIRPLPRIAAHWARIGKLFRFNPTEALLPKPIPAGLYSYVQQRAFPYTIYLMFTTKYESLHTKQVKYLEFKPTTADLLSAGEIATGTAGNVAGFSFRTGGLRHALGLIAPDINGQLLRDVGLPIDLYYDAVMWTQFQDIEGHFTRFFDEKGRQKILQKESNMTLSITDQIDIVQRERLIRQQVEATLLDTMPHDMRKLFNVLQSERAKRETSEPLIISARLARNPSIKRIDVSSEIVLLPSSLSHQRVFSAPEATTLPELMLSASSDAFDKDEMCHTPSGRKELFEFPDPLPAFKSESRRVSFDDLGKDKIPTGSETQSAIYVSATTPTTQQSVFSHSNYASSRFFVSPSHANQLVTSVKSYEQEDEVDNKAETLGSCCLPLRSLFRR